MDALCYRVRAKRLRPVQRGVYAVGRFVSRDAKRMAAVLASGPGAVLSHLSGASLRQMLSDPGDSVPLDVTVPRRDRGRRPGLRVHRVDGLSEDEVTRHRSIPVTTPARTLLDLAGVIRGRKLEQALAVALRQQLTSRAELFALLDRYPRRPGVRALRAVLEDDAEPAMTRSEAEERLLALTIRAQLGKPRTNVRVEGCQVDFYWPKQGVVWEVDGFAYHSSSQSFEGDRRRDAQLTAAGYSVQRVTWKQMVEEPEAVVARLAQALTRGEMKNRAI